MSELARVLGRRGEKLFGVRTPLLGYWQELAWHFYPERADFLTESQFGEDFGAHLYDEGPVVFRRELANAFAAHMRPAGQRWFKPTLADEDLLDEAGVADWLGMAGEVQRRWMYEPQSRFVRSTKSADHDFACFGNAVLSVETRGQGVGLTYCHYHLRDCAWTENSDGEIDTLFRTMKLSARQIKQKWPKAKLHEDIIKACEKEPDKEFCIWHVMMPVQDLHYDDAALMRKLRKFPFASIYLDKEHHETISVEGSHEFRYVVARWHPVQGWPYAISPATSDALPGARQLQAMARTGTEALEKSVDPPVAGVESAIRGDINLFAGGVTWIDPDYDERTGEAFRKFDVGKDAILALQAIAEARLKLRESMFVSKLNIPTERAKTAYETQQLVEEYIRGAIPLFEPVQEGYNAPLLDMTFKTLFRQGAFGPFQAMPEALHRQEFEWSFENPLQLAMERVKVQTFITAAQIAQAAMELEAIGQEADLDVREAKRDAMRGTGMPESWLRDKDEADEASAQAAQVKEAATLVQGAGMAGAAAESVGKGLAQLQAVA